MIGWLIENLSTLIVLAVVIAVVSIIVIKLIKDKKAGNPPADVIVLIVLWAENVTEL